MQMSVKRFEIPYGHEKLHLEAAFPSWELLESCPHGKKSEFSEAELVVRAMESPIGSAHLEELAAGKKTATVILSDHTRPVPSRVILPPLLEALRKGSPDIRITLLVATGCHRGTTVEELRSKLGDEILKREKIVIHDCDDAENMIELGRLPSGGVLKVNRLAAETDLLVAEGFIEPHFFAGFSGGRKSVLPGVCARETVMYNHCAAFIDSSFARTGNLENNPIHQDMIAAAKMAGLRYIVNVILNKEKQVVHAVAGDAEKAHLAGCRMLMEECSVHPARKGDIVITSNGGAPLDQNIYQVVKSLSTAEAAAAKGAALIVCAKCEDGTGGEAFYRAMKDCSSPEELLEQIRKTPPDRTVPDQWQYQILCRILQKFRVIFVTRPQLEGTIRDMKMEYCSSLEEAAFMAMDGNTQKHVVVIPDGVSAMIG
ncbi:MAG: nickel-dependent lactate racemase [Eubacteriales bacterium]|nr:nickel-dependent lactate racemase [Eubacteriales bacterium]